MESILLNINSVESTSSDINSKESRHWTLTILRNTLSDVNNSIELISSDINSIESTSSDVNSMKLTPLHVNFMKSTSLDINFIESTSSDINSIAWNKYHQMLI